MTTTHPVTSPSLVSRLLAHLAKAPHTGDTGQPLKRHRATAPALADLLVYAAVVADGVIVGKNGSLIAAWIYEGEDNASSTDEYREMTSRRINQALANLGSGWMIHVDAARRSAPGYAAGGLSHFPDPVSAAIDEERRQLFERLGTLYDGCFVLTLTYFPPLLAQSRFVEMMFDDDARTPDHTARTLGMIDYFQRECATLQSRLSSVLKLERLVGNKLVNEDGSTVTHDDFLRWLQFCVTGLNHPIQLPSNPMYIDALLGGQELSAGVVPKIGHKFIQVVAIEGLLTSLNDILIPHLKAVYALTYGQAMLVQFCFFSAYFLISMPAGRLIRAIGYQRGVVVGLSVAALGCGLFYPASTQGVYVVPDRVLNHGQRYHRLAGGGQPLRDRARLGGHRLQSADLDAGF